MGVKMTNLKICIAGYTDTVSVYVNDQLLELSTLFNNANYICTVSPGLNKVRIEKNSGILNSRWKKKVALNWLSSLSGVPDFTLREALLEANISFICFNIDVTNADELVYIKIILNSSGFEIEKGIENCKDIQGGNRLDKTAMKRIKCFYLLPIVLLLVLVIGLLIVTAVFFAVKSELQISLILLAIIVALSSLFIYCLKKSNK